MATIAINWVDATRQSLTLSQVTDEVDGDEIVFFKDTDAGREKVLAVKSAEVMSIEKY